MSTLKFIAPCLVLVATIGSTHNIAAGAMMVDKSGIPVNDNDGSYVNNGGVQFLNPQTYKLQLVEFLMGGSSAGTLDFQVIEFDGGLGDRTGSVIGTIPSVAVDSPPFNDFATDSVTIDVSPLNLTLNENTVYGFAFNGTGTLYAGTSYVTDSDATVNAIFNGNGAGEFISFPAFEIPFTASGTLVPEPTTIVSALFMGLIGACVFGRNARRY